jgi:hypothetical protein
MNNFRALWLLFLFTLLSVTVSAQYKSNSLSNGLLPNVLPVSPEAGALGKYGDWPVSLYTGIPQINIPIYTVRTGGFELPVSLSYHAGGVKVDEVASWVGTGFSLNAGGVISRTIVGKKDEDLSNQGGFLFRNLSANFLKSSYDLTDVNDYTFFRNIASGQVDTEPDMFFYNFAGYSGKFYFDRSGQFRAMPANSLKLVESPVNIKSGSIILNVPWKIIDEKGNTFLFSRSNDLGTPVNGSEDTRVQQVPVNPEVGLSEIEPTAWYLTQIIPANKSDTIFFDYGLKDETYFLPVQQSFRYTINFHSFGSLGIPPTFHNAMLYNGDPSEGTVRQKIFVSGKSALQKIRWKHGELRFTADMSRQDITGKQLTHIALHDTEGNKVQGHFLNYEYINGRYYLSSLVNAEGTATAGPKHTFSYYNPSGLPARNTSYAQDHWGYYNGRNNANLLPWHQAMLGMSGGTLSADREPNETFNYYGTLSRITYPTGGYSDFVYESNRYLPTSPIGGGNPPAPIITAYASVSNNPAAPYNKVSSLTIPFDQNVTVSANFVDYPNVMTENFTWSPSIKIERIVNNVPTQVLFNLKAFSCFQNPGSSPAQPASGVTMTSGQNGTYNLSKSETLNLTAGEYRITVDIKECRFVFEDPIADCGALPGVSTLVKYDTYGEPSTGSDPPLGGGLRIRKITDLDRTESIPNIREYTYAPGNLLIYPKYLNQYEMDLYPFSACAANPNCNKLCAIAMGSIREVTSTSQSILGFTQGAPVGYTSVREVVRDVQGNENGFTNYRYSYTVDSLNEVQNAQGWSHLYGSFDIMNSTFPTTSFDFKRGNLLSKSSYKKSGNVYLPVDSISNVYVYNDYNTGRNYNRLRGMRIKRMKIVSYPCGTSNGGYIIPPNIQYKDDFVYAFYDLISGWSTLSSTVQYKYDVNGLNPVISETSYFYDNPLHMQVSRMETVNSVGSKNIQYSLYPHDYPNTSGFLMDMKSNHLIAYPIEQVLYREVGATKNIVSGHVTTFKPGGKALLDQVSVLEMLSPLGISTFKFSNRLLGQLPPTVGTNTAYALDARYKTDQQVLQYDNYGNPLEIKRQNLPAITYIWGYKGQYPIAEIRNASYGDVVLKLGGQAVIDQLNSISVADGVIMQKMDALRANLPNAQVTSYTYKPLIGMTSKTDARGITEYYKYDGMQRLQAILDHLNNVNRFFDYHYRSN